MKQIGRILLYVSVILILMVMAFNASGQAADAKGGPHKTPKPEPCKGQECGQGDTGNGNPENGSDHANCNAQQGEVDPPGCTPSPEPTVGPGTPVVNPPDGQTGDTSQYCGFEGPTVELPETGIQYIYTLNGQMFIVQAFEGSAFSNGLSLNAHQGLCFDLKVKDPKLGQTYTYRVTDSFGNEWVWEDSLK